MQQEGDAGGAARKQTGAGQEIKAECCNQAAGENALQVLDRRVPGRAGVPNTENAAAQSHGKNLDWDA
ncbi:hypothetical protein D9M69_730020 [compost metagenome]